MKNLTILRIDNKDYPIEVIYYPGAGYYFKVNLLFRSFNKQLNNLFRGKGWRLFERIAKESLTYNSIPVRISNKVGKDKGTYIHITLLEEVLRYILSPESFFKLKLTGQLDIINNAKPLEHLYCIKCDDDSIKVGITTDIKRRFREIQNQSGKTIVQSLHTEPLSNAYYTEQEVLSYFDKFRRKGEWLNGIDYETVINYIQKLITKGKQCKHLTIK